MLAAESEVQEYLRLWDACRTWHALPRAGGMDEQPAREMAALRTCESAMSEYLHWRRSPPELSPEGAMAHLSNMVRTMGGQDRRRA